MLLFMKTMVGEYTEWVIGTIFAGYCSCIGWERIQYHHVGSWNLGVRSDTLPTENGLEEGDGQL